MWTRTMTKPDLYRTRHRSLDEPMSYNCYYSSDETPLHVASIAGQTCVAELLLEYGAVVNAQDKNRKTPLYLASQYGRLEFVQVLLEHGADVHIRGEDDLTPFQVATLKGHVEIAQLLVEHGAEKN